ncbi:MAG: hypothetical protein AB3N18_11120 [Allomuricauda sp.]
MRKLVFGLMALFVVIAIQSCEVDSGEVYEEPNTESSGHEEEPDRNSTTRIEDIELDSSGHSEEPDRDS